MTPLTEYALVAGGTILCVCIGFLMGMKSARPDEPIIKREFDPGPTDDPGGDIWQEALTPAEDDTRRIPTR